jgi:cytoskeletal protein CcmA (bactofilin family)
MTLIPADTKDSKDPSADPISGLAAEGSSHPHQDQFIPPPAYSETDESCSAVPTPDYSISSSSAPPLAPIPGYKAPLVPPEKIPESNAIDSNYPVNLVGPLHILGSVKSHSSITLSNHVTVEGKVSSSSWILLEKNVVVHGKVDASGSIKLRDGVHVTDKADASGSIEYEFPYFLRALRQRLISSRLSNGISVGGKVSASGNVNLTGGENGISVHGKVTASGRIEMKGWVEIGEDVDCNGSCKFQGYGPPDSKYSLKVGGKIKPRGACTLEGNITT